MGKTLKVLYFLSVTFQPRLSSPVSFPLNLQGPARQTHQATWLAFHKQWICHFQLPCFSVCMVPSALSGFPILLSYEILLIKVQLKCHLPLPTVFNCFPANTRRRNLPRLFLPRHFAHSAVLSHVTVFILPLVLLCPLVEEALLVSVFQRDSQSNVGTGM